MSYGYVFWNSDVILLGKQSESIWFLFICHARNDCIILFAWKAI